MADQAVNGIVTVVFSRQLLASAESGMTPQQKTDARIASTFEAQEKFEKTVQGPPRAATEAQWSKIESDVVKNLRAKDPDILNRPLELLDSPDPAAPAVSDRGAALSLPALKP